VGLIAREIEARGIPTICLSSAHSITRAVNPPRAVFLDFPLGHTAGKPGDQALQRRIMIDTLSALDEIQVPGTIRTLAYQWAGDDGWKDTAMRAKPGSAGADNRLPRNTIPQYQFEADELAAVAAGGCPTCVFLDDC
jgi:D-proline reductase (dithiol) PrdB